MEAQGPVASPTVADPIKPSALAPAAWRYSPRSAALYFDQPQNDQQNNCADESVDDRANNATSDYHADMR